MKSASNMQYNFKEVNLGPSFRKEEIKKAKELINSAVPFTVVGMPVVGISFFLKYLTTTSLEFFIHIDINELPSLNKTNFLLLILKELGGKSSFKSDSKLMDLCRGQLEVLVKKHKKVILAFNRFDRLQKIFDQNFFANLRTLWEVDEEKIVMVFTANRSLVELAPEAVSGGNFNLCSKVFYLAPSHKSDLEKLVKMNTPELLEDRKRFNNAAQLSGGHYQLCAVLLKSELLDKDPLGDAAISFQLKELFEYLNYGQRKQLQKLAFGRKIENFDYYLIQVGYIKQLKEGNYQIFSPLLENYIRQNSSMGLPVKENRLFQLLKSKKGQVVTHDEIFQVIWQENYEEVSNWSLNALIYRLRKNPVFIAKGYSIESYKKVGYGLVKN